DATTLSRVAGLLQSKGKAYQIKSSPFTSFADMRGGPVVLVGGFNNSWTLRLTSQLRFNFERDRTLNNCWINDRQNPSQKSWLVNVSTPYLKLAEDYALITRVFDPTTEQIVVVAAGIGIYGTMAAGEFVTGPSHMEELIRQAPKNWERKNIQA